MTGTINKSWHLKHPMPKNATHEQRLEWHLAHSLNCACREMPDDIRRELEARGLIGPSPRSLK
jgi:hypothetical protein